MPMARPSESSSVSYVDEDGLSGRDRLRQQRRRIRDHFHAQGYTAGALELVRIPIGTGLVAATIGKGLGPGDHQ